MESKTQGSRPRPRTQKNFEAKDRPSRGQGQGHRHKCSQKKRSSKIFFMRLQKKGLQKFFSGEKGLQKFFSGEKGLQKIFFRRKRSSKIFFQAKKVFKNFFSGDLYLRKLEQRSLQIFRMVSGVFQKNFYNSKIVLSSSRGQANFRGLEAKAKDFEMCSRGLHLW